VIAVFIYFMRPSEKAGLGLSLFEDELEPLYEKV
jgi:hypothetical protein